MNQLYSRKRSQGIHRHRELETVLLGIPTRITVSSTRSVFYYANEQQLTSMPSRRLEDRIRELASRIAVSQNGDLADLLTELQQAMKEHALRVQNKTMATVFAWPELPRERRRA